ncbi:hypothetical protein IFM89_038029 [Coptis chinensis]|uniref:Endonuclease/exonuclease/phosphatase domain-containing protein n=1 Tax=Coptis chinensis TaxID=261450 RepID=A0A835HS25_9MAGN|nr:hypothetical protein IFM89_038029 [Coptis chinensis]
MITSSASVVFEAAKEKEATIYDPTVDDLVTPNRFRVLKEGDNLLNGKWANQVEHDGGQVRTKKGYKPMWKNAWGVKRQEPWYHIEELVLTHNPEFLCIAEPLIKPPNALPPVLTRLGFSANFLHNNTTHRQITVKVKNSLMTFVHASSSYGIRREFWQELSLLGQSDHTWAVIGDFNIVTSVAERKRGGTPCLAAMDDFNHFIHSNALIDSTTLGFKYSWCNKRWGSKRMLQGWLQGNVGWRSRILKRKISYHSPIVGWNTRIPKPHNIPFQFQKAWIHHDTLKDMVEANWNEPLYDVPIGKVVKNT